MPQTSKASQRRVTLLMNQYGEKSSYVTTEVASWQVGYWRDKVISRNSRSRERGEAARLHHPPRKPQGSLMPTAHVLIFGMRGARNGTRLACHQHKRFSEKHSHQESGKSQRSDLRAQPYDASRRHALGYLTGGRGGFAASSSCSNSTTKA